MKRIGQTSLLAFGIVVCIGSAAVLVFGKQVPTEMMFATLAGLVIFLGISVFKKIE